MSKNKLISAINQKSGEGLRMPKNVLLAMKGDTEFIHYTTKSKLRSIRKKVFGQRRLIGEEIIK